MKPIKGKDLHTKEDNAIDKGLQQPTPLSQRIKQQIAQWLVRVSNNLNLSMWSVFK